MKKNKNFIISIIILIIVFIIFVILMRMRDKNVIIVSSIYDNKTNLVKLSSVMQDKSYVIQSINDDNAGYFFEIYYPKTMSNSLNSYIDIKTQEYINNFKQKVNYKLENNVSSEKYYLKIKFDTKESNNYLSFIFYVEEYTGFIHPDKYIFTINYSKKDEKVITIDDIIKIYPNFLFNVSEYAYKELKEDKEIKKYNSYDMLKNGTQAIRENYERFCLEEDNITVFFETYQIAPYILGSFELKIPISTIKK